MLEMLEKSRNHDRYFTSIHQYYSHYIAITIYPRYFFILTVLLTILSLNCSDVALYHVVLKCIKMYKTMIGNRLIC